MWIKWICFFLSRNHTLCPLRWSIASKIMSWSVRKVAISFVIFLIKSEHQTLVLSTEKQNGTPSSIRSSRVKSIISSPVMPASKNELCRTPKFQIVLNLFCRIARRQGRVSQPIPLPPEVSIRNSHKKAVFRLTRKKNNAVILDLILFLLELLLTRIYTIQSS